MNTPPMKTDMPELIPKCVSCKSERADIFLDRKTAVCLRCYKGALGNVTGKTDGNKKSPDRA